MASSLSHSTLILVTIITSLSVIICYVICIYILSALTEKFPSFPPYLPFAAVGAVLPVYLTKTLFMNVLLDLPSMSLVTSIETILFGLAGILIFEVMYFEFVHPVIMVKYFDKEPFETFSKEDTAPTEKLPSIVIANKPYLVSSILSMQSNDHYVTIQFKNGKSETFYSKLAELTNQTEDTWGISPHRSYWVNKAALSSIEAKKVQEISSAHQRE